MRRDPTPVSLLRIYSDDTDTVIARSVEDAIAVCMALSGNKREDYNAQDWGEDNADEPLTINDPDGDGRRVTMTGWDWIIREGRGFLCSTEY